MFVINSWLTSITFRKHEQLIQETDDIVCYFKNSAAIYKSKIWPLKNPFIKNIRGYISTQVSKKFITRIKYFNFFVFYCNQEINPKARKILFSPALCLLSL